MTAGNPAQAGSPAQAGNPAQAGQPTQAGKPTPAELGVDPAGLDWQRSGSGDGSIEVAFVHARDEQWVLMRVAGDSARRVLVFDRNEWVCFLDGARNGEFDDAGAER